MYDKVVSEYYKKQALQLQGGNGGRVFRGTPFMRGHSTGGGLGSILSSVFKAALPVVKSAGRYVAKKGASSLAGFAGDIISGETPKMAAKKRALRLYEDMKRDSQSKIARMMNDSSTSRSRQGAAKKRHKRKNRLDNFSTSK